MPRRGSPYSGTYERQRKLLLARIKVCQWCGELPATVADHEPPIALHAHVNGSGCCTLVASCRRCNGARGRGGWWIANARSRMRKAGIEPPRTWREPPAGVVQHRPARPARRPDPVAPLQYEYDETWRPPEPHPLQRRPTPRIW